MEGSTGQGSLFSIDELNAFLGSSSPTAASLGSGNASPSLRSNNQVPQLKSSPKQAPPTDNLAPLPSIPKIIDPKTYGDDDDDTESSESDSASDSSDDESGYDGGLGQRSTRPAGISARHSPSINQAVKPLVSFDQQPPSNRNIAPNSARPPSPTKVRKEDSSSKKSKGGVKSFFGFKGSKSSSKSQPKPQHLPEPDLSPKYDDAPSKEPRRPLPVPPEPVPVKQSRSQVPIEALLDFNAPDLIDIPAAGDLKDLTSLCETYDGKLYLSGYLYKLNDLSEAGQPLPSRPPSSPSSDENDLTFGGEWAKWWYEVRGACLYLWRVPESIAAAAYYPAPSVEGIMKNEMTDVNEETIKSIKDSFRNPLKINIFSSTAELLPYGFQPLARPERVATPLPPIPYDNFVALSTSGSNLYQVALRSSIAANAWVGAIRLAIFEGTRVCEHFTLRVLGRQGVRASWSEFGLIPFKTGAGFVGLVGSAASHGVHFEGVVAMRYPYLKSWEEAFIVVSNFTDVSASGPTNSRESTPLKKLFSGGRKKGHDGESHTKMVTRKPEIAFYASESDYLDGKPALFKVEHVRHAYMDILASDPSKPAYVKIEGLLTRKNLMRPLSTASLGPSKSFGYPGPGFNSTEPLNEILLGKDGRPLPQFVQIVSPDAAKWLMAIAGAFQLDTDLSMREKEIMDGEVGLNVKQNTNVVDERDLWGPLYLSPPEVAGLAMSPETLAEVKVRFAKVLSDKAATKKAGFLSQWVEAVTTGIAARTEFESQEVKSKVEGLVRWLSERVPRPAIAPSVKSLQSQDALKGSASMKSASIKSGDKSSTVTVPNNGDTSSQEAESLKKAESVKSNEQKEKDSKSVSNEADTATDNAEKVEGETEEKSAKAESVVTPPENEQAGEEVVPESAQNQPDTTLISTDLVLVPVPTMQPDGTWAWQYQFANGASLQSSDQKNENSSSIPNGLSDSADAGDKTQENAEEEDDDDEEEDEEESESGTESSSIAPSSAAESRAGTAQQLTPNLAPFNPMNPLNPMMPFMPFPMMGMMGVSPVAPPVPAQDGVVKKKKKKAEKVEKEVRDDGEEESDSNAGSVSEESDESESGEEESGSEEESEEESDEEDSGEEQQPGMMSGVPSMLMPGVMPGMMPGMPFVPGMMMPGFAPPMAGTGLDGNNFEYSDDDDDDDEDEEEDEEDENSGRPFQIYSENSLLGQLPEKANAGTRRQAGPLIQLHPDVKEAHEKLLVDRQLALAKQSVGLGATVKPDQVHPGVTPLINTIQSGSAQAHNPGDPLIDVSVPDKFTRPKIEGGLLGVVDRIEKEREMLKKLGQYRPALNPKLNPAYYQNRPVGFAPPGWPQQPWGPGQPAGGYPGYPPYGGPPPGMAPPGFMGGPPGAPYGYMQGATGYPGMPPPIASGYPGMAPNAAGYPGMPPNAGGYPGMPGMPPNVGYPGMTGGPRMPGYQMQPGYAASEYGMEGYDDPMAVMQANIMRERWLETERLKERQRMVERGEMMPSMYGMPNAPYPGMPLPPDMSRQKSNRSASIKKKKENRKSSSSEEDDSSTESSTDSDSGTESSDEGQNTVRKKNPQQSDSDDSDSDSDSDSSSESAPLASVVRAGSNRSSPVLGAAQMSSPQMPMMSLPGQMGPYGGPNPYSQQPFGAAPFSNQLIPGAPGSGRPLSGYAASASGRDFIGERKRPPVAMKREELEAKEEEEMRRIRREEKERERERKRKLRRRGIQVDDDDDDESSEETDDRKSSTRSPTKSAPQPKAATNKSDSEKSASTTESELRRLMKEMMKENERLREMAKGKKEKSSSSKSKKSKHGGSSSKKKSKKRMSSSDEESDDAARSRDDRSNSSSEEEVVVVRRKKKSHK
ncbi:hypothetical protein HDV05_006790 [Chytridiales sp. JEL 0842]|nr:hypothetical protein HDV05_006790 [Chytridiales sp. JEL 0842]